MKKMFLYEAAMCDSTNSCGVSMDPELIRISTVTRNLMKNGIEVVRYNLSNTPQEFSNNQSVNALLLEKGSIALPITIVDGEIVKTSLYPTNGEIMDYLSITEDYLCGKIEKKDSINGKNIL